MNTLSSLWQSIIQVCNQLQVLLCNDWQKEGSLIVHILGLLAQQTNLCLQLGQEIRSPTADLLAQCCRLYLGQGYLSTPNILLILTELFAENIMVIQQIYYFIS